MLQDSGRQRSPTAQDADAGPPSKVVKSGSSSKPLKYGSCMACRQGKMRCDRGGSEVETPQICSRCSSRGLACEYQVHKTGYKVGPTGSLILRSTQGAQSASPVASSFSGLQQQVGNGPILSPGLDIASLSGGTAPSQPYQHGKASAAVNADSATHGRTALRSVDTSGKFLPLNRRKIRDSHLDLLPDEDPILRGILSYQEAAALFLFYYGHLQIWNAVLDIRLHTLEYVQERSTFLLCVILTQAAAHHEPSAYFKTSLALHTQALCGRVVASGYRSPELVAAFMLYATWLPPGLTIEQDISWSMAGISSRMADEIGLGCGDLSQPTPAAASPEQVRKRRIENRFGDRLWLQVFIIDKNMSSQLGRPPSLSYGAPLSQSIRQFLQEPGLQATERHLGSSFLRRSIGQELPPGRHNPSAQEICRYRLDRLEKWKQEFYAGHTPYGQICYSHDRMLVLGSYGDHEQEILAEGMQIVRLWLDNIVACGTHQYTTNLAASLVTFAASTVIEIVAERQARLPPGSPTHDLSMVRELVDDMLRVGAVPGLQDGWLAYYSKFLDDLLLKKSKDITGHPDSPTAAAFLECGATLERDFMLDFGEMHRYFFPGWMPVTQPHNHDGQQSAQSAASLEASLANWLTESSTAPLPPSG